MTVLLLALGGERYEIYAEPPDDVDLEPGPDAGRTRRWAYRARVRWRELVAVAQRGETTGRLARWRDALICRVAESIAEQRTLWELRKTRTASLLYPSSMTADQARRTLDRVLAGARWHHGVWLAIDLVLLLGSAVLAPIPGPNAVAYYIAFRVVGHAQSALGAYRGSTRVAWTLTADPRLAELAALAGAPHAARASRVAEIAAQLMLHRFTAYFDRITR